MAPIRRRGAGDVAGVRPDVDTAVIQIEVESLTKVFGQKTAVDGIDLSVDPGTFLVLLGPSGSGKSTLLRCLAGIERASGGSIRFGDTEVDGPRGHLPPERRDLAMVFQDYALWPHLTAEDNVAFALRRRRISAEARRRQSLAMLDKVGLSGLHGRYPSQLSGGEQQRVALARALVGRPGLLLFDEPLSNLDADRREHLRVDIGAMVREQGATSVYITHDQSEAFALADVVGVLRAGRLVQIGPPEEIYRNPADDFVARFTGLAGELPGRILDDDPSSQSGEGQGSDSRRWLTVDIGGRSLRARPVDGARLHPGQSVQVLVRPSAVRFATTSAATAVTTSGTPTEQDELQTSWRSPQDSGGRSTLAAVVRDAAFRGWGYEHVLELPGGHRLAGVGARTRLSFATSVHVELDAEGCLVAPSDSGGGRLDAANDLGMPAPISDGRRSTVSA